MRLISLSCSGERVSQTFVTDMSVIDFVVYMQRALGNLAVTYVLEISDAEAQRWDAQGHLTLYKRNMPR